MLKQRTCEALAAALEYPNEETAALARIGALTLDAHHATAIDALNTLADELDESGVHPAEERYTRLFDLKPVCTLNIAWHIFGDTYDRGALLAHLVPELEAHGIEHRHDLPDYLPTLLRLLGRLQDDEERQLLTHSVIMPGLKKVASKLAESTDPWSRILSVLPEILELEVPKQRGADIPVPRKKLEVLPPC